MQGATTVIATADPPRPPISSSGPDSDSITCSLYQGHGANGKPSVGLELANACLGRFFFPERKKCYQYDIYVMQYPGTVRSMLLNLKHGTAMPLNKRCVTRLDQLWTTYNKNGTRRRVRWYVCVHRARRDWHWCRVR